MHSDVTWSPFVLSFCGKIYIGLEGCIVDTIKYIEDVLVYCYNVDEVVKVLERYDKDMIKHFNAKKRYSACFNRVDLTEMFNAYNGKELIIELHQKYKTPLILFKTKKKFYGRSTNSVVLNPSLKNIQFYKVIDTFKTFQEIAAFVSGVLPSNVPEPIQVTEKTQVEKHGFNKWSFRRHRDDKK